MGTRAADQQSHAGYRCFVHEDRHAVAACRTCDRRLCADCASYYRPAHCHGCTLRETGKAVASRVVQVLGTIVIAAATAWLLVHNGKAGARDAMLIGGAAAFGLHGWAVLARFFPAITAPLPVFLILIALRLWASVVAGLVAGPYRIARALYDIAVLLRLRGSAKRCLAT